MVAGRPPRSRLAAWSLAALLVTGCGDGLLTELAQETCAELDGAIVLQVGSILSRAIEEADDIGMTAPELGAAMRAECPSTMAAIENVGEEQERREELPALMRVTVARCSQDGAAGTVVNGSDVTVDLYIEVQYLDAGGVVVDDGIASLTGLRAGETGEWDASRFDDRPIEKCRADVSSAFGQ